MKIIEDKIQVGSDPELFLFDPKTNKFISSIDMIGGSKYAPQPMDAEGFFVQEDNVLVEYNIPPASNEEEFVHYITSGMDQIRRRVPQFELKIQASAFMPEDQLQDPRAQIFGCDPDFCAWNGKINPPISQQSKEDNLRSAGGHISVGYNLSNKIFKKQSVDENIIRWLDLRLGVPSVIMDPDKARRSLYGKAGAYRSKPFGVEYRTLSSFWLGSQKLMRWAYQNTILAVKDAGNELFLDDKTSKLIQKCINTGDEKMAADLAFKFNLEIA